MLSMPSLTLWGLSMGLERLFAMVFVSQVPYFGFFIITQMLFTAFVVGYIAQSLYKMLPNKKILILLNFLLFTSIPFQCHTLAFLREVPYSLFLLLASITIFLLILKNSNKLTVADWLIGVVSVFMVTQFRVDGILIAFTFFVILCLRLIYQSLQQSYENFWRPLLCFFVVAGIATLWIGISTEKTSRYGASILQGSGVLRLAVNPDIKDSDPDNTKAMLKQTVHWEQYIKNRRFDYGISTRYIDALSYRSGHKDVRLIYENIIQFLIVREEFFFEHANMYRLPLIRGFRDDRSYHCGDFYEGNFNKSVQYAKQTGLISENSVQPKNPFFKTVDLLHKSNKFPLNICWSFLPPLFLLLLAVVLYSYFPASACASVLILSSFPLIFLISPLLLFMYYLFIFYGGLIILPFIVLEFQYRRQQLQKKVL
jgi:hypothetical protein